MELLVHGQLVSEEQIDCWVDEAETGYDVSVLKSRMGRPTRGSEPSQAVPVRLTRSKKAINADG
jgi:hypothetical protein